MVFSCIKVCSPHITYIPMINEFFCWINRANRCAWACMTISWRHNIAYAAFGYHMSMHAKNQVSRPSLGHIVGTIKTNDGPLGQLKIFWRHNIDYAASYNHTPTILNKAKCLNVTIYIFYIHFGIKVMRGSEIRLNQGVRLKYVQHYKVCTWMPIESTEALKTSWLDK